MSEGYTPLAVIAVLALVTLAIRWFGFWIMGHVPLTPRVRAGLEALPGAIMISAIAPVVIKAGPSAIAGTLASAALMAATGKDILALVCGLGLIAALRYFGLG